MSYESKQPLMIMSGKVIIEGKGWDGKDYRVTFHKFISHEATTFIVKEVSEDEILYGDNRPYKSIPTPPEFYLEVDELRLFQGDDDKIYTVERLEEENGADKSGTDGR